MLHWLCDMWPVLCETPTAMQNVVPSLSLLQYLNVELTRGTSLITRHVFALHLNAVFITLLQKRTIIPEKRYCSVPYFFVRYGRSYLHQVTFMENSFACF